jgi:hypothetical protein
MIELVLACMLSSYHIGNSLMNDGLGNSVNDKHGIEAITEAHGQQLQLGYHIDSSQAMHSIWNNPNGVGSGGIDLVTEPYTAALTNHNWDAVLLEPYLSQSSTFGSDKETVGNFIDLIDNSQTAVYVYQVWPRQSWGNYGDYWTSPIAVVNDSTATRPKRDFYSALLPVLRLENPGKLIRQVPTGEVWYQLSELIDAGSITEVTMANLYRDDLHGSGLGRYIAAATIFSTLYRQPVTELPPVEFFGTTYSPELYHLINNVIWSVVSSDQYSGVGDFNDDGLVDSLDLFYWQENDLSGRDFLAWQRVSSSSSGQQALTAFVPEPGREVRLPELSSIVCLVVLSLISICKR